MSFIDKLDRARAVLERQGRLSARALGRELGVEGDELEELIEELVDVQQLARREGKVLVWAGAPAARRPEARSDSAPQPPRPTRASPPRRASCIDQATGARRLFAEMGVTGWDAYARSIEA